MNLDPDKGYKGGNGFDRPNLLSWLLLALCIGLACPGFSTFAAGRSQQERVLSLCSFEDEAGVCSDLNESLRATLRPLGTGTFTFSAAFLDQTRFPAPEHAKEVRNLLRLESSLKRVDSVFPVSKTLAATLQHLPDSGEKRLLPGSFVLYKGPPVSETRRWQVLRSALLVVLAVVLITFLIFQYLRQKRAEVGLEKSEARYLAFVANSSEGISRFEADTPIPLSLSEDAQVESMFEHGYVAECNEAFARMYGVASPKEMVGTRLADLLVPSDPQNLDFLHAFIRSRYRLRDHVTHERDPEGNMHWFENGLTGIIERGCLVRAWVAQREITDRKRAEEALHSSEARYRNLVESSHDWVWEVDAEGVYTYAGPQCREILGYDPQEIIGRTPFDLMPPEEAPRFRSAFSVIAAKHRRFRGLQNTNLHKDGRLVVLERNGVPVFDDEGRFRGYRGMDRNITARKQMEDALHASEELNRATFEQAGVGIVHVGTDGRFLRVNGRFCAIVGYSREELTKLTFQDITYPEDLEQSLSSLRRMLSGETNSLSMEKRYVRKDGSVVWANVTVVRSRTAAGEPGHLISVMEDITERKRTERALEEYREAVENSVEMMFVVDREYRHVLANRTLLEMSGLRREQVVGHTISEVVGEEFFHRVAKPGIDECFEGKMVHFESEYPLPGKGVMNFGASFCPIHGSQAIDRVCCVMHDITARKRAERALVEYEKAVENSEDVMLVLDREYRHVLVNRALEEKFGMKREQVIGHTVSEVVGEEYFHRVAKPRIDECFAGEAVQFESVYPSPLIGERHFIVSFYPVQGSNGTERACCIMHDITERKRAEEEIRDSRDKYQALIEATRDFIWEMDVLGRYTYCSPQMEKLWGLKPEALIGRTPFEVMPAEQRASATEAYAAWVKSPRPFSQVELDSFDGHGNLISIEASGIPFFDPNGKLLGFRGITRDITERKRAEKEITDRLRFETLLAELSSRFVRVSVEQIDEEISYALRRVCETLDLEMVALWRELAAAPGHITLTHAYGPVRAQLDLEPLNGEDLFPWCFRRLKDGEIVAVSSLEELPPEAARDRESWRQFGVKSNLTFGLVVGGSSVVGALAFDSVRAERAWPEQLVKRLEVVAQMFSNALARLDAERALRASEERFRGLVENATVGIYRTTPDGRVLASNPTLVKMLGYADFESLAARNLEQEGFEPTYSRKEFRERIEREGQVLGLEAAWHKSDGSIIFMRESARAIRGQNGKILYYDGIVEDITDRKRTEEALFEIRERFGLLSESSLTGIYLIQEGRFRYVNPAMARMFGYAVEEVVDRLGPLDLIYPDDRPIAAENLRRRIEGKVEEVRYEFRGLRKDGSVFPVEAHGRRIEHGGKIGVIGTLIDNTERKRAEEALQQQAAFDELMTGILSRFATCAPSDVDSAVVKALEAIAEFIGADHAYVIRFSENRSTWSAAHEWCGAGLTPRLQQFQSVPFGTVPRTENMLLAGEAVRINSPDDYTPDAVIERRHREMEGHLAALNVPLRTKAGIFGNIGLHSHARSITWTDDDVARVRLVSEAIANALERKQAFEELRKSEEMFSTVFHASPVAMTIVSLATGRYLNVNRAFEEMTGFGAQDIIGRTPQEFGRPAATKETLRGLETQYKTKSGEVRTWLLSTEPIEFGGEACSLRAGEDITERKRSEQSLSELGRRLLMVQETERRRVARELHDDFSQRLALLAIDLEKLAQRPPAQKRKLHSRLLAMWTQTQELTSDIHRLSRQLHPSRVEDLGLVAAVRSHCRELSHQAGFSVKFSAADVPRDLPKEISLCIYRVAQEALGNVVKHSGAKTAEVELSGGPDEVRLVVSDPGKGFDVEDVRASKGLGLVSMQERVRFVGGSWSIDARPSGGTRVVIRIPVPAQQAVEEMAQTPDAVGLAEPLSKDRTRTRVLLADDHTLLLEAFKGLLEPEFEVVGAVADGRAALAAVEELNPELVVLDIAMPRLNGLDAARQILAISPNVKVIFLTMNPDPEVAQEAMRLGASGYLLKTSAASELRKAIREAVRGLKYVSPGIERNQKELFTDDSLEKAT